MAHCTIRMLGLQTALTFWDLARYMAGSSSHRRLEEGDPNDDSDADTKHVCKAREADEAITSIFWWCYLMGIAMLAQVIIAAIEWAEGCMCHGCLDQEGVPAVVLAVWDNCPMRGFRAAELAAGEFMDFIQQLLLASIARLAASLSPALDGEERLFILQDVERGRVHLVSYVVLKLSVWNVPYWMSCGAAHSNRHFALSA